MKNDELWLRVLDSICLDLNFALALWVYFFYIYLNIISIVCEQSALLKFQK